MKTTQRAAEPRNDFDTYPRDYFRTEILSDGTVINLRSIRSDDSHLWLRLLNDCSAESIYRRFFSIFPAQTPATAMRFCSVDFRKEIAIVAEIPNRWEWRRNLLGIARMITKSDQTTAELAILVADVWQHKGLGTNLTDSCLKIAHSRGIKHITAEIMADNARVIRLLRKFGFHFKKPPGIPIMGASLDLK